MNRNTRRMLTAGVSILALAPLRVIAATVAGTSQTSIAATSVDLDLNLSNIASPPILGIDAVTSALVTSTAAGQVYQYGSTTAGNGVVDLTMTNPTGVTIQAIAVDLGGSTAFASIESAIYQSLCACNAGGVGSATIDNDAAINIIASASVDEGSAEATAYVQEGVMQSQYGDEGGSALIDNSATGTINISAVANAVSTGGAAAADAYADVDTGIYQYASASTGDSTATITNNGGITISAVANASGDRKSVV